MMQLSNIQPSPYDARDHLATIPTATILPKSIDLKPLVFEVENQGQLNTCTANAGCSALELMYNKNKTPVDLSRLFLYYYSRKLGNIKGDSGSYPRDMCKALKEFGTCPETNWPYASSSLDTEPTTEIKALAEKFKIYSYEQIQGDKLTQIKNALNQDIPVLLTIQVHRGFGALTGNWKTHTWDWETSATNPLAGWHEVLIIGYDDDSQRLLVENSWGPAWADGGFFGIPYAMISSQAFGELWILNPNLSIPYVNPKPVPFYNTRIGGLVILALLAIIATILSK